MICFVAFFGVLIHFGHHTVLQYSSLEWAIFIGLFLDRLGVDFNVTFQKTQSLICLLGDGVDVRIPLQVLGDVLHVKVFDLGH